MAQVWGDQRTDDSKGWKVAAGFRPLRIVGAEIQYVDFGEDEVSKTRGFGAQVRTITDGLDMKASATAWVVSALLFIPERSPMVDVYGKVGMAALDESLEAHTFHITIGNCVISACPRDDLYSDVHESDTRPYLGIGARFLVGRGAAVRVEYEAIDRDTGDETTMFSVGVGKEF